MATLSHHVQSAGLRPFLPRRLPVHHSLPHGGMWTSECWFDSGAGLFSSSLFTLSFWNAFIHMFIAHKGLYDLIRLLCCSDLWQSNLIFGPVCLHLFFSVCFDVVCFKAAKQITLFLYQHIYIYCDTSERVYFALSFVCSSSPLCLCAYHCFFSSDLNKAWPGGNCPDQLIDYWSS